ncbi:MAG: DNA repair protein RadA [Deltaproteobacteria bacterium]|nr:DNA repair protein RadA [Deltaproteobacteria bacterium]
MKTEVVFVCRECDARLLKWMGRCPQCGQWNSIEEKVSQVIPKGRSRQSENVVAPIPIDQISHDRSPRLFTGMDELDRVLGGGLVRRSVILVGGDPGIGKSTLLMQALGTMSARGENVLYVSGEESLEQIKIRADRLGVSSKSFLVVAENELERILELMRTTGASVVVLDSAQSVSSQSVDSHPGSVSQVRHVAAASIEIIKRSQSACFLVGHVTKDGALAGPKVLEHMVDTVLYFEGDRGHPYRILRAVKNRFGSVSEIGVFEMTDAGLSEVVNPSEFFLSERPEGASGSVVTALVEGSRPILAEVQALVSGPTPGSGRRTCLGTDPQRLALMLAVIEKKLGFLLNDHDIFLNAVGGVRATEPAVDLGIVASVISSFCDRVIPFSSMIFGEVGLSGEVRPVAKAAARINEAARLGYSRIVGPKKNLDSCAFPEGAKFIPISHIRELPAILFEGE